MVRGPDGDPYVSTARRRRSTGSASRRRTPTRRRQERARRPSRRHGRDAALPRGRRPGPADPRLEERAVALAPGRRQRQGHAHQGHAQRARPRSATTSWTSNTYLRRRHAAACTTCTSSIRPSSRSAPTRRRPTAAASRLKPAPWLAVAATCRQHDLDLRRRRHLRGRRRRASSGTSRARARAGTPKAPKDTLLRPAPTTIRSWPAGPPAPGRHLRLRQAERPGHRAVQDRRQLSGAVPAGRRRDRLGRPARDVHRPGLGDGPSTLVWASNDGVNQAVLVAVPDTAQREPEPQREPGQPERQPEKATPKPTKKP